MDIINDVVEKFKQTPTLDNFLLICDIVTPDMLRGSCNKDEYGYGTVIHTDIVHVALVYKGIKPMASIQKITKKLINELNIPLAVTKYRNTYMYVVYLKYNTKYALKFIEYLAKSPRAATLQEHYQTMGTYLGYPQEDIDYFISKNAE